MRSDSREDVTGGGEPFTFGLHSIDQTLGVPAKIVSV
jgi:hypothetical protein